MARCTAKRRENTRVNAPLTGKLFTNLGRKLSPTHSGNHSGRRYRYYAVLGPDPHSAGSVHRVSAPSIERFVQSALRRIGIEGDLAPLQRIVLGEKDTRLFLPARFQSRIGDAITIGEWVEPAKESPELVCWSLPTRWSDKNRIETGAAAAAHHDETLIRALRRAHDWLEFDRLGRPSFGTLPRGCYERRILKLAFLAPDIQATILAGRQPRNLSLEKLVRGSMPLDWTAQRQWISAL